MSSMWLLVDGNYMARRAFYSTGGMSFHGVATGISYGVLRDLESMLDLFGPVKTVVAFDSRVSLREKVYPQYKQSRKTRKSSAEDQQAERAYYEELDRIKREILPEAGFSNVVEVEGYEADDIIAQVAVQLPLGAEAVIVSSDSDLLQCISSTVSYYNLQKQTLTTLDTFRKKTGLQPDDWARVKAIAGCVSDDIEGISGVGETFAARWLLGQLKPESKAFAKIEAGISIINRNLPLVRLPYPGLVLPPLRIDVVDQFKIAQAKANIGMKMRRAFPPPPEVPAGFSM